MKASIVHFMILYSYLLNIESIDNCLYLLCFDYINVQSCLFSLINIDNFVANGGGAAST